MSRIFFLLLLIVCVVTVQCHIHHEEHGGHHKCIHDELHEREAKEINGVTQQMSKPARFEPHIEQMIHKKRNIRSIHEDTIVPLRVDFRTDYLDKSNDVDQRTCYEVGQVSAFDCNPECYTYFDLIFNSTFTEIQEG